MAIVEYQLIGVLRQTGFLLLSWLIEAIIVQLDIEAAGQEHRAITQCRGIAIGHFPDCFQIFVQP